MREGPEDYKPNARSLENGPTASHEFTDLDYPGWYNRVSMEEPAQPTENLDDIF